MTQPQTAPQTPPATPQTPPATPQTPPATPQAAVKPEPVKFAFPFPGLNTLEGKPTEVPANIYIKTWGQYAMDGFYPIGLSGQWHGGIHFDDNTGTQFNQTLGVRCIADGEVIAWRYDEQPQVSEYNEGQGKYSTGFVLVRHRLQYQYPKGLMSADKGKRPE